MHNKEHENKSPYKHTLNIVSTDFPMRADAKINDPIMQKRWEEEKINEKILASNTGNETYVLNDGPPYTNGPIHLGHAYNKIIKDIIMRSRRMMGYHVSTIPAWDCHGLPIEQKVAGSKSHLSKSDLEESCRKYSFDWVDNQRASFKKLGVLMHWSRPYLTMDFQYQASIMSCFADLVGKGFINRTHKTISWCPVCSTALASAEIEYHDRNDPSVYVAFKTRSKNSFFASIEEDINFLIWTTTPWTIPLNRGVMLKAEGNYSLIRIDDKLFIVGSGCVESLSRVFKKNCLLLSEFKAEECKDILVEHPTDSRITVPVVFDKEVSDSEGTSCVHIAPGCGPVDYEVGVKNGLEIFSPIDKHGAYTEDVVPAFLTGKTFSEGQELVVNILKNNGSLIHATTLMHSYPHCWRCKSGLIFRATPQWFFDLSHNNLKQKALDAIKTITFFPESGRRFLTATIENRWEWCLSRQRVWGVPIAALLSSDRTTSWIDADFIRFVAQKVSQKGIRYWHEVTLEELVKEGILPENIALRYPVKEYDILDVWFDSGVSHTAILKKENQFPADLYLEGLDQHRGWFQSSLLTSVALHDEAPMKAIMTHGFTVDEKGHKMSKSLGNVIEPQFVIDKVGTDGLRLWAASIGYDGDAAISEKIIDNIAEVYRKIRNTCRFLLQNSNDIDKNSLIDLHFESLHPTDAYVLFATNRLYVTLLRAYQQGDFTRIFHELADYCSSVLSSFYFDISKDILYCSERNGSRRRSVQSLCHYIVTMLAHVIAPIMPHTAESIYDYCLLEERSSIHLSHFPDLTKLFGYSLYEGSVVHELAVEKAFNAMMTHDVWREYHLYWKAYFSFRSALLKAIENARDLKIIKHSLEAVVYFSYSEKFSDFSFLSKFVSLCLRDVTLDDHLSETLVVSRASCVSAHDYDLNEIVPGIFVSVVHSAGLKCPRCWKWHDSSQELCHRCERVISSL